MRTRNTNLKKVPSNSGWLQGLAEYVVNTNQKETDSEYLRRTGLKPTLIDICGDCTKLNVLDVGTGDGWVLQELSPCAGVVSDIAHAVDNANMPYPFVMADVCSLPFSDNSFDLVVASLVLMWVPDLQKAYRELWRVVRPKGRVVVAIVHPYFYRTGKVSSKKNVVISRDLSSSWEINNLKIGGRSGPFEYYYHRYDEYVMSALRTSLVLTTTRDWFIDLKDYKLHVNEDEQIIRRSGLTPLYSFFSFKKARK